jgi:hypothetical protein
MNARLAKPIPLGLVYCGPCRAFGDTEPDAGRLFAGAEGGLMQILGRGRPPSRGNPPLDGTGKRISFCGAQFSSNEQVRAVRFIS